MTPDNNNHYVTRREWDLVISELHAIDAKLDAVLACLSERVTRQEYDHHREVCAESTRRIHDRIDEVAHRRVDRSTLALVSLLSSLLVGVAVALITVAIHGGL